MKISFSLFGLSSNFTFFIDFLELLFPISMTIPFLWNVDMEVHLFLTQFDYISDLKVIDFSFISIQLENFISFQLLVTKVE